MIIGFTGLTPMELLIILVLAVLLFGKKLPDVGRTLGKGIVAFKKGLRGNKDDIEPGRAGRKLDDPETDPPGSAPSLVPRRPKPPKDSGSIAREIPPSPPDQG